MKQKAIFLDRDGIINKDKKYVYKIEDFEILPGVFEDLRRFQSNGFKLIIMTNQSGIGRGYYTEKDFLKLNKHMLRIFKDNRIAIEKVYYCPHIPEDKCNCRKPKTKLIEDAVKEFDLNIEECWVIGDKLSDIKTGENAGCRGICINEGINLHDATSIILGNEDIFDRKRLEILPLALRENKTSIRSIALNPDSDNFNLVYPDKIEKIAHEIIKARKKDKPVIVSFGAHLIKNGLGLVLKKMIEEGYITHLATNGAGSIHDWEFAFQGRTEEDVKKYINEGKFGLWEETGKYINLAIIEGAENNEGYGTSIGKMIYSDKVGKLDVAHPFKEYSVQNSAFFNHIPFTVHPGFGYDIIYTHPLSDGASIGKVAERDFLKFTHSVSNLEGGVYISIGSAIMSPMIFEKALSMARNVAIQNGKNVKDFMIVVNDIQKGNWDFNKNIEPSKNNPAYYLRFCKSFSRMGAREMYYIQADNRDFLLSLYSSLKMKDEKTKRK